MDEKPNYSHTIVGILSASELTLGSYLHFLRVPFTGQFLALNQCFWLNVSKNWSPEQSTMRLSFQLATIKLMSPLGKKLTPMIAIAVQGTLFETGCLIFGPNIVGRLFGSILMSFWPLIQPFCVYVLLLGNSLFTMTHYFEEKIHIDLYTIVSAVFIFKALCAVVVSLMSTTLSTHMIDRYGEWLQKMESRLKIKPREKKGLRAFVRSPLFYSMILVLAYLFCTVESFEQFLREAFFYCAWMFAVTYFLDIFQAKIKKIFAMH